MKTSSLFPRVALCAGVLSTSVLFAGCKKAVEQVKMQVQETVAKAENALLSEKDLMGISDPLVRKSFVAQANARAYRVVTASSAKGAEATTTEIVIQGTNVRFHTTSKVAGKAIEMVVIGDTTYVKDQTDGKWWKQVNTPEKTKEPAAPVKAPNLDDIKQEFTKKQEKTMFKQLGTENCPGATTLTCYKYQEIDEANKEDGRLFWFDNKDFLLHQDQQKFGSVTSTNLYTYDNVNIPDPTPTKDVPEGKNIYMYMMGGVTPSVPSDAKIPSKAELDALMKQATEKVNAADTNADGGN